MLTKENKQMHGTTSAKGCSHLSLGSFCKMFPELSSWAEDFSIKTPHEAEKIAAILGGVNGVMHDSGLTSSDSDIPAAYTFFAQFIDHDVTLETTTKLHGGETDKDLTKWGCPHASKTGKHHHDRLPNLRSTSLDLDCVYGFGPEASPHLYDTQQPGRLLVGNETNKNDLARTSVGTALIGDPRNDENIFVSQMQLLFIKFHNRRLVGRGFEAAQRDVRYHYQYLVWNDFLKRVCDPVNYDYANGEIKQGEFPKCSITDDYGQLCMPVEFSVAAYRFGHTMVRSVYPVNADHPAIELFDERFGTEGFSAVPSELTVDWKFLLDVDPCNDYVKSKAIDHLLTDELIRLPNPIVGKFAPENDRSLAFRNLLRGYVMRLPSGQKVAAELADKGYKIELLKPEEIKKALYGKVDVETAEKLSKSTPLFFYILLESCIANHGKHLGSVGSAILLEVFGNMLFHCDSFLHQKEEDSGNCGGESEPWSPDPCLMGNSDLTLGDIVRYVNAV